MTEKKKKILPPETKIHLRKDMYFLVTPHSFDLYYKTENSKAFQVIGYFNSLEYLLKTATQILIANMRGEGDFRDLVKMWRSIFAELTQVIKENNL